MPPQTHLLSLPNELLLLIASYLSPTSPSTLTFAHEPSPNLTSSPSAPLKALSLVSHRLRSLLLPLLFSYARIPLSPDPQWVPIDARLLESMQGQLTALSAHELHIYTRMRSKFKSTAGGFAFEESFDDLLINLCRVREEDSFLKAVPNILWLPHLPDTFRAFAGFLEGFGLRRHVKSVVVYTDKEYELLHVNTANAPLARAVADIWTQVFALVDPIRLVVAAPPTTMAGLLDTQTLSLDAWAFNMKMHYMELRQPEEIERNRIVHVSPTCRMWDSALIHRRPWIHIGYNEGSSIEAYSTYEYHLKQSPMMLYQLLLRLAKECQPCCNIRSFSFIGIFPFSTSMTNLIRALYRISTLRKVQIQLAPGPENDIMDSSERMGKAQPRDLWLEWNECYKIVAVLLGLYDFTDGSEFVSRDSRGTLTAETEEHVEKLVERGVGWRKVESGEWVMDHAGSTRGDDERQAKNGEPIDGEGVGG
ncbi:hypothetical protein B0J11DRAFT_140739 [Dendryphion nanum]|uniref:F-box domain-containing protein n=1 Tax=Dendryphion nanum TaxID=256645 RepID=A0A9P9D7C6_9PLEO|nr:hypothetical protein B0J11DRAFT_140739 [Dendryphion nanum]